LAIKNYKEALEIYEKLNGKHDQNYISTLNNIGNAYHNSKNYKEAL
jgi:tetratricopeptide (TPR) repeat protein